MTQFTNQSNQTFDINEEVAIVTSSSAFASGHEVRKGKYLGMTKSGRVQVLAPFNVKRWFNKSTGVVNDAWRIEAGAQAEAAFGPRPELENIYEHMMKNTPEYIEYKKLLNEYSASLGSIIDAARDAVEERVVVEFKKVTLNHNRIFKMDSYDVMKEALEK